MSGHAWSTPREVGDLEREAFLPDLVASVMVAFFISRSPSLARLSPFSLPLSPVRHHFLSVDTSSTIATNVVCYVREYNTTHVAEPSTFQRPPKSSPQRDAIERAVDGGATVHFHRAGWCGDADDGESRRAL